MLDWNAFIESDDPQAFEMGNIWGKGDTFRLATEEIARLVEKRGFDAIAAIEAKGIIFGSALSTSLGKPLVLFRKQGRLRSGKKRYGASFLNWRGEDDGFEIEEDELRGSRSFLVVDDLIYRANSIVSSVNFMGD